MSVGDRTEITSLGEIPENFSVKKTVNQIAVLQTADVFITHCGMNSVNESLYFGVPMILFPQHSEQKLVADQAAKLGAGLKLESEKPKALITAVEEVMKNPTYKENAIKLSKSLQDAGGAKKAADVILANMNEYQ